MSTQQPDSELGISPDAPVLGQVEELPASHSEVKGCRSPQGWEFEVLRTWQRESFVYKGLHCLLDAFYSKCGYMSDWQDPEGIFPGGRYRTRRDALPHVEAKWEWLNEVHGIDHTALIYLSGNKCVYDTIPVSAH
jgi:hypothetical protein